MSTIFAIYNVSHKRDPKGIPLNLIFVTSILEFNEKLKNFPKNIECDAYEALLSVFLNLGTSVADRPGRP